MLNTAFFVNNRHKLIRSIGGKGVVVVAGNGQMQRTADTAYPFRQDSNFYYLTGIEEPNAVLVLDIVTNKSYIMLPIRTGVHAIFDGSQDIEQLKRISGVDEVIDINEGWIRLKKSNHSINVYMPQKPVTQIGEIFTNPFRAYVYTKIKRIYKTQPLDIRPNLAEIRSIKSSEEIKCIQNAVQITLQSIQNTLGQKNIDSEYSFEAELSKQFRINGATGHAYSPIVASGQASCTLHYVDNNAKLRAGDVLLLDVGAEYNNYAADISRTKVWGKTANSRQESVINAVNYIQQQLIEYLKPGLSWKEFAAKADELVGEQLVGLGLVGKDYSRDELRRYFPHSVSHFLGLDVHDVGDYTKPLQPGMVITVEPGIYITDENLGVRIEDDVVITSKGAKIIS